MFDYRKATYVVYEDKKNKDQCLFFKFLTNLPTVMERQIICVRLSFANNSKPL